MNHYIMNFIKINSSKTKKKSQLVSFACIILYNTDRTDE